MCVCVIFTHLSNDWLLWLFNFRHLFSHIAFRCACCAKVVYQKVFFLQVAWVTTLKNHPRCRIRTFTRNAETFGWFSNTVANLKLESSKFSSSFVILSESRGRASSAAADSGCKKFPKPWKPSTLSARLYSRNMKIVVAGKQHWTDKQQLHHEFIMLHGVRRRQVMNL